jgi:hypothetical protein
MKTLLLVALIAAFIGLVTSVIIFYQLVFAKKTAFTRK